MQAEQRVKFIIGDLTVQVAVLQAELEKAQARIKELEGEKETRATSNDA